MNVWKCILRRKIRGRTVLFSDILRILGVSLCTAAICVACIGTLLFLLGEPTRDIQPWFFFILFLGVSCIYLFFITHLSLRGKMVCMLVCGGAFFLFSPISICIMCFACCIGCLFDVTRIGSASVQRSVSIHRISHYLGFVVGSFVLFIGFLGKIQFSVDEGFILLFAGVYIVCLTFFFFLLLWIDYRYPHVAVPVLPAFHTSLIIRLGGVFCCIFCIVAGTLTMYWSSLDIFRAPFSSKNLSRYDVFRDFPSWDSNQEEQILFPHQLFSRDDIIDYIRRLDPARVDRAGALFLLTGNEEWGNQFKQFLLAEAGQGAFLDSGGSVKAWQYNVTNHIYYYVRIQEEMPAFFSPEEKMIVAKWVAKVNRHAYRVTVADWAYGILFRTQPIGLYYNQEIGFGMLALFSEVLREYDPLLVERNLQTLAAYAVGWEGNFRNTDDGIEYHQNVWNVNAYLLYRYAGIGDVNHARYAFDWILYQSPYEHGKHPNYNSLSSLSAANSMVIGMSLLRDGRYRYIADNFLFHDKGRVEEPASLIGFDLWDDTILPVQPETQSYVIWGTTGLDSDPKELMPDKLSLRRIVNGKELFILINLRSSGWHRYNGSGSVILVKYGNTILAEDRIVTIRHDWLPKGKAEHRDKKINASELTLFSPPSAGIERFFSFLFAFDRTLAFRTYPRFLYVSEGPGSEVHIVGGGDTVVRIVLYGDVLQIIYPHSHVQKALQFSLIEST